jgi:hypothetical protein
VSYFKMPENSLLTRAGNWVRENVPDMAKAALEGVKETFTFYDDAKIDRIRAKVEESRTQVFNKGLAEDYGWTDYRLACVMGNQPTSVAHSVNKIPSAGAGTLESYALIGAPEVLVSNAVSKIPVLFAASGRALDAAGAAYRNNDLEIPISEYNEERPHSTLRNLTPKQFAEGLLTVDSSSGPY